MLYIDNDAHHGDGVEFAFAGRDDVLTISLHESGRYLYPGTGFVDDLGFGRGHGYSVNLPLEPFTDDNSWLARVRRGRAGAGRGLPTGHHRPPERLRRPRPRPADPPARDHPHGRDGGARGSTQLAHELCDGRLIVLGGGGYDIWSVVPRAWTLVWCGSQRAGRRQRAMPAAWRARWQPRSPIPLPTVMRDDPADYPPLPRQPQITAANAATLRRLRERLHWLRFDDAPAGPPADPKAGW